MKKTRTKLIHATVAVSLAALALTATQASAVDIGVGVGLNNEGGGDGGYGMSMPLRFGNITVEPELTFYRSSQDTTYTTPTNNYTSDSKQYTLDTGIYLRHQVVPALETYLGGRVGYTKNKYSYTYPYSPSSNQSNESSGFYLGPTFGAEYFFEKRFSMSLDVSVLYESTSGHSVNGATLTKQDGNSFNYQTRARLHYYF